MKTSFEALRIALLAVSFGLALWVGHSAHASQEGLLRWATFSIECPGIGSSGPVMVSGKQDGTGPTSITVKAFGRTFDLERKHLEMLKGMMMNGLQLSYEGGYKELGGRTLYLKLSSGFMSGVSESRTVTIAEGGDIKVERSP